MEKTIKEWFETFPEPYRSQAFENVKEQNSNAKSILKHKTNSAISALNGAFVWSKTPKDQGFFYWQAIESGLTKI